MARSPFQAIPVFFAGITLVGLAFITVLGWAAIHYAHDGQSWVDHTQQVIGEERALQALLLDAETGARGYLLTRDPAYLEPWTETQTRVAPTLRRLVELTRDNGEQQTALARLDVLIGRKFELTSQEIAAVDRGGAPPPPDKMVMDSIRRILGEFEERELALYRSRTQEMHTRFARLQTTVLLTWLFSLGGLGFGAWTLRQSGRRIAEAEAVNRQARKMEAIGNLTGGIAHDFNNLLQVIITNLDLALRQIGPNQPASGFLHSAMMALEKGERLTSQLLAFARRQPLNPQPINVAAMIEECGALLRRTLGEAFHIECVSSAGLWRAMVDSSLLQNAIVNLALNARDAMPGGGRLTIEASNVTLDTDYADRASEVSPGAYVLIAVSDTGIGMTRDMLSHVFEPFYTTKETGTGLGLPMVYGFVKQSGGHIAIYSEPGQGTTVKLYLPRTTRIEADLDTARRAVARGRGQRILVVEDDDSVRAGVVAQLSDLGYGVLAARDADTALDMIRANPEIDLLFTDVILGGRLNGRQLADAIREQLPTVPVVFTSGYTENAIVHHGRLNEGVTLLSKPYRADQLASVISNALGKGEAVVAAAAASPTHEGRKMERETETILLIDDNKLVRTSLIMMLEDMEYDVIEAETAKQALEAAAGERRIDAALVDVRLPDMDGLELATRLRGLRPMLRLIIVSGQSVSSQALAKVPGPTVGMLLKPFTADQLEAHLYEDLPGS